MEPLDYVDMWIYTMCCCSATEQGEGGGGGQHPGPPPPPPQYLTSNINGASNYSRVKNGDSVTNLRLPKFDDFLLYFRTFATK